MKYNKNAERDTLSAFLFIYQKKIYKVQDILDLHKLIL